MNRVAKFLQGPFLDWGNKLTPWIGGMSAALLVSAPFSEPYVGNKALVGLVLTGILASTCISGVNAYFQKTRKSLEEELSTAKTKLDEVAGNMDYLFRGLLVDLWRQMRLKSEHQARISIYVHHKDADSREGLFTCCSRYSRNPRLEKRGRSSYPDQQGYIKEGWENGWHYDDQFPPDEEACRQYHENKYGIPPEILRNFKLLARFAVVQRLDDNESNPQAVIVIEGRAKPARLEEMRVKNQLKELAPSYAHMVKVLWNHISLPEEAKEKEL